MFGNRIGMLSVCLTVPVLLLPLGAVANDGMPASIFELVQEGQNVKVVLQMADPGDPGIGRSYELHRNSATDSVTVIENHTFDTADAVYESGPGCRWTDPPSYWCGDYPEQCSDCDGNGYAECFGECVVDEETEETVCEEKVCESGVIPCYEDCDGDGTKDCYGWCQTVYRFEMVDECVPEGTYEYELFYQHSDSGEWYSLWTGTPAIDVVDSGQTCDDTSPADTDDGDDDTSGSSDEDGDENGNKADAADGSGCSVSAAGVDTTSLISILYLL